MFCLATGYTVLATVWDENQEKQAGFVVIEDGEPLAIALSFDDLKRLYETVGYANLSCHNGNYDQQYNTVICDGGSFMDYPRVTSDLRILTNNDITVTHIVYDEGTGEAVGVHGSDARGMAINMSFEKLYSLRYKYPGTNYEFINDPATGKLTVKPRGRNPFMRAIKKAAVEKHTFNSANGEAAPEVTKKDSVYKESKNGDTLPELGVYSIDTVGENELALPTQHLIGSTGVNIRKLAPYYGLLWDSITKELCPGLNTFAVTEDKMLYDLPAVAGNTVPELTFIMIHEMCHICMSHSVRRGNRHPELWNIACDLYINELICSDFGCKFGGTVRQIGQAEIKAPNYGCFMYKFGMTLDFAKDTPETLYAKLLEENPDYDQKNGQGGSQNDGQGGQPGTPGSGNGGGGKQDKNTQTTESSNGGSNGEDQTQGGGNSGNDQQQEGKEKGSSNNGVGHVKNVTVKLNGKTVQVQLHSDLMTNDASNTEESKQKNQEATENALQRVKTKIEMEEEKLGEKIDRTFGIGGGLIDRYIEFGLSQTVDWRTLIKNLCVEKPKKKYTLAMPNVDYMNMGITFAERHKIGKPTKAAKFVVGVDVSGSVTDSELKKTLSEINNLCLKYDVDGELVYWSTKIGGAGQFTTMQDLLKVEPISTGGTDVCCLFEYLMGNTKSANGKTEQLLPRDIRGIFIITDGCFAKNYGEYAEAFGQKTVWMISGNVVTFDPMFGSVVSLDNDKED